MGILREIRALPGAIRSLTTAVQEAASMLDEAGPAIDRLEELERSRTLWEAQIEALILKAESTYKSAANSESRARTMERRNEKNADPFAEDSEEVEGAVPRGYEPASEEEALQPLHLDLARPVGKTNALRSKFMI